jgi:hypothetical protein
MSRAAEWAYFAVAWIFILLVLLKRWRAREHRDQKATDAALASTRHHVGDDHYWDA